MCESLSIRRVLSTFNARAHLMNHRHPPTTEQPPAGHSVPELERGQSSSRACGSRAFHWPIVHAKAFDQYVVHRVCACVRNASAPMRANACESVQGAIHSAHSTLPTGNMLPCCSTASDVASQMPAGSGVALLRQSRCRSCCAYRVHIVPKFPAAVSDGTGLGVF